MQNGNFHLFSIFSILMASQSVRYITECHRVISASQAASVACAAGDAPGGGEAGAHRNDDDNDNDDNDNDLLQVDGWNAWYCRDRQTIKTWPGWNRNNMSIGALWVGFLDFFANSSTWDDTKLVVSIRQSAPLTKFEKMWISPCIAIEDPFELSHNLGAGLSRKSELCQDDGGNNLYYLFQ